MTKALLAVDTATESCGVCVMSDGMVRAELMLSHGQTHTRSILQAVDSVLSLARIALAQIDAFAVTRGPGSFTGLRIGISTVKGLAFAVTKPVVGVSSLDVLAHQAGGDSEFVCPVIDARRREVYWRIYSRKSGDLIPETDEQVGPVDQLAGQIEGPSTFIGNGAALYAAKLGPLVNHGAYWAPSEENAIRPAVLARLAWRRFEQGRFGNARELVPVYLRKSDAELNHGPGT